ncbi:MAG: hypothetical protein GY905_11620 [Gammaproteobacteria bacterium]|nr:hypothetical protein [Gammaproteobacteria bacterium]
MSKHDPKTGAFYFTAYDEELAIFIDTFDVMHSLKCVVKSKGNWQYVTAPTILKFGTNTKEEIDAEFEEALVKINKALALTFGKAPSTEPQTGVERVQWLLSNKVKLKNGRLTIG